MFQTQLDKTNWGYFGFCSQVLLMEGSWVLCLTMSALDVRGLFSGNVLQSPVINDIEFHRNTGVDMKTIELKMRPDTFHFWYFHSFAALSYFVLHPWIDIRLAVLSEIIDFIGSQAFLRVAILRLEIFRCLQAHNFSKAQGKLTKYGFPLLLLFPYDAIITYPHSLQIIRKTLIRIFSVKRITKSLQNFEKNGKIFAKLWKEWQNLCKTVK